MCCALYLNDVCIGFVWKSLGILQSLRFGVMVSCCFSIKGYMDIILWFYEESSMGVNL